MSDLTPAKIFNDEIPAKIQDNLEAVKSIDAVYQFHISGDDGGDWTMDLTADDDFVTEGTDEDADCVVKMSSKDFIDMWTGKLAAPQAFMMGKLKISGNMGLAMKLTKIIGG